MRSKPGLQLQRKADRRSGGACAPGRRAPRRRSAKLWPRARTGPFTSKRTKHRSSDPLVAGAHDGEGARSRKAGSGPHRPAVRRSRLRPDRRHSGGSDGAAARHDHHEYRAGGRGNKGQARTGRRLVPARRNAAARAADDAVRRDETALRHADGHQEGEDAKKSSASRRRNWQGQGSLRSALDRIYHAGEDQALADLRRPGRRKRRRSWSRSCGSRRGSYERRSGGSRTARRRAAQDRRSRRWRRRSRSARNWICRYSRRCWAAASKRRRRRSPDTSWRRFTRSITSCLRQYTPDGYTAR